VKRKLATVGLEKSDGVKSLSCPACHTTAVRVRTWEQHTHINCYNGECGELPELNAHNRETAIRFWERMDHPFGKDEH